MKTLILSISIFLTGILSAIGQNYIGRDQSAILRRFGEPAERGDNYFVYNLAEEEGSTTYYFNEENDCVAFSITRTMKYYDNYQAILKKEFKKTEENKYVKKSKKRKFQAEINKTEDKFEIKVQQLVENQSEVSGS